MLTSEQLNGRGEPGSAGIDEPPRVKIMDLDPPVEYNGRTYTTLTLEEPTANMVERAEAELANSMNIHTMRKYQIAIVSLRTGMPRQAVDKLRISQLEEAANFLQSFINNAGRRTGEN